MAANDVVVAGAEEINYYFRNYSYANMGSDLPILSQGLATDANKLVYKNAIGTLSKLMEDNSGATNLTDDRVLVSNNGGKADVSAITSLELSYLDNATGNIQDQIGASNLWKEKTKDPTGFTEPENVIVTYDPTARTVTLTGTVEAYYQGQLVTALVSGWVSSAHAAGSDEYFLYYNGTSFVWTTTPWDFDDLQIAVAYRNNIDFCLRECHGMSMDWATHEELHRNIGTYTVSGGDFSNYTLSSTTAADRRPDISALIIQDEDLPTTNAALTTNLYAQMYLTLTGTTNANIDSSDIIPLSGDQPYYNEWNGSAWVQTLFPNNNYGKGFILAIPASAGTDCQKIRYLFVQPQDVHASLDGAQSVTTADIDLGHIDSGLPEFVYCGEFIVRYTASNWQLIELNKITGSKLSQQSVAANTPWNPYTLGIEYTAGNVAVGNYPASWDFSSFPAFHLGNTYTILAGDGIATVAYKNAYRDSVGVKSISTADCTTYSESGGNTTWNYYNPTAGDEVLSGANLVSTLDIQGINELMDWSGALKIGERTSGDPIGGEINWNTTRNFALHLDGDSPTTTKEYHFMEDFFQGANTHPGSGGSSFYMCSDPAITDVGVYADYTDSAGDYTYRIDHTFEKLAFTHENTDTDTILSQTAQIDIGWDDSGSTTAPFFRTDNPIHIDPSGTGAYTWLQQDGLKVGISAPASIGGNTDYTNGTISFYNFGGNNQKYAYIETPTAGTSDPQIAIRLKRDDGDTPANDFEVTYATFVKNGLVLGGTAKKNSVSGFTALQSEGLSVLSSDTDLTTTYLASNLYSDGAFKYMSAGAAAFMQFGSGAINFATAVSGSADAGATVPVRLQIANDGSITMPDVYGDTIGGTYKSLFIDSNGKLGVDGSGGGVSNPYSASFDLQGETSTSTTYAVDNDYWVRWCAPFDMDITELGFFVKTGGTDTIHVGIYSDTGTLSTNLKLQASSQATTPSSSGMQKVSITTQSVTGGTTYWLCIKSELNAVTLLKKDLPASDATLCRSKYDAASSLPANMSSSNSSPVSPFIAVFG